MQVSDNVIKKFRSLRQGILDSGSTDIKMSTYLIPASHDCEEPNFLDKGYYRLHNGEIYICHDGEEQRADFRAIECQTCHQEFFLMNTGVSNWDFMPNIVNENQLGYSACKK